MIYLWDSDKGWTAYNLADTDELRKHGVMIGNNAWIGDNARIGSNAVIGDDARPTIIYIVGSKHTLSYWGEPRIDIGRHHQSIRLWQEHFREIGVKEGYSPEQIEEYERYIEMVAAIHAARPDTAKAKP